MAEASTWPDFMRSDESEFWHKESPNFHFVTVPAGKTYAEVGPPPEGDALTALDKYSRIARDKDAALADRQLALRLVIHIVEDLHQPLHCGNGTDRGGNQVTVTFMDVPTNLHSVWDERMIDAELLSHSEWAEWLGRRITPALAREWMAAGPLDWVAESVALRDTLYPADAGLSYPYVYRHKRDLDRRLQQGGVRLANYLNTLFAGDGKASVGRRPRNAQPALGARPPA